MTAKEMIALDPRIIELKEKIKDEKYIQGAIQRLALVLSSKLTDGKESYNER